MSHQTVLLTGATGFVGRALYPRLVRAGFSVRCASRHPDRAEERFGDRDFVRFEALDPISTKHALAGCDVAYYLVHGLGDDGDEDYADREWRAATIFAAAAERAGVKRIVYLGGVAPDGEPSKHLRSRLQTGEVLRGAATSTIELRAAMVVGEGSVSWQIVRDLAMRLPVMILPRWLESRSEPVWIGDVAAALTHAASNELHGSAVFDVPGPDRLSAREVLQTVARLRGRDPVIIDAPILTPALSTRWIALVTRADAGLAGELVEGLLHDLVSGEAESYWPMMGDHRPLSFVEAAERTLRDESPPEPRAVERVAGLIARRPARDVVP